MQSAGESVSVTWREVLTQANLDSFYVPSWEFYRDCTLPQVTNHCDAAEDPNHCRTINEFLCDRANESSYTLMQNKDGSFSLRYEFQNGGITQYTFSNNGTVEVIHDDDLQHMQGNYTLESAIYIYHALELIWVQNEADRSGLIFI